MEFPALVLIFDCHLYYVANSVAQLRNEDLCANKYYTVYSKPACIFFFAEDSPNSKRWRRLLSCMLYLYFINLTYNAITDKFRSCQEGDRKRQGYQAEGQYNFVERKHIRLAKK